MRGLGGLADAVPLELDLGQAVVTADQQRVDRRFQQVQRVRAVLGDAVTEREPDGHRLDAHVLLDIPALQHLGRDKKIELNLQLAAYSEIDATKRSLSIHTNHDKNS